MVVGGGIAGLVAARDLAATGRDVLLLEGSPQVGGKLRSAEVAGLTVDVGAEAMLARRPEGLALAEELGAEVVHPTPATSAVWSRGALRRLPRSLMGVPLDLDDLAASGVLSPEGLARASAEVETRVDDDASVGDLVAARLGDELVDRLVEPLLGGVYAGHARRISAAAAVPQLLAMARRGSLLEQASGVPASVAPVFASLPGGMGRLPALVADGGGFEVRTSATVRALRRTPAGWALAVGPTASVETVDTDTLVVGPTANAQPVGDQGGQATHPAGQRGEDGSDRPGDTGGLLEQAAAPGHGEQLRHGGGGRDAASVPGVHAAEQRLDEAVDEPVSYTHLTLPTTSRV